MFCVHKTSVLEISIQDPVGEALSADSDALQHTVTAQLVHDQRILHRPRSLSLIGDDAAHKVRVSLPQVGHQLVQVLLWIDIIHHSANIYFRLSCSLKILRNQIILYYCNHFSVKKTSICYPVKSRHCLERRALFLLLFCFATSFYNGCCKKQTFFYFS